MGSSGVGKEEVFARGSHFGNAETVMPRTLSVVKELVGSVTPIYASLISALTVRFLWIDFEGIIQSPGSYWEFVAYSVLALRNALIPSLLAGLAMEKV